MALHKKPEVVVFAGPNGSGKSTLTGILKPPMAYINADDIKASLHCTDMEAAVLAEKQRQTYLFEKNDFCFETVLSTERNLNLLRRARETGSRIYRYCPIPSSELDNLKFFGKITFLAYRHLNPQRREER